MSRHSLFTASLQPLPIILHESAAVQEAMLAQPMDIEELARQGRAKGVCPYYASRAAAAQARFVLLPYSALLSEVRVHSSWSVQCLMHDSLHNSIALLWGLGCLVLTIR